MSQAISKMEANVGRHNLKEETNQAATEAAAASDLDGTSGGDNISSAAAEVGADMSSAGGAHQGLLAEQGSTPADNRVVSGWVTGLRNRKLWATKSSSFTRAASDHGVIRVRTD